MNSWSNHNGLASPGTGEAESERSLEPGEGRRRSALWQTTLTRSLARVGLSRPGRGIAVAAASLLAGCQTGGGGTRDYAEFQASRDAYTTASHIADSVKACWFAGKRPAFAGYSYVPELTSYSDKPRILIVPKHDPGGLPKLIIQAEKSGRGSGVRLFGPLMASAEAPAIRRDVKRWTSGGSDC